MYHHPSTTHPVVREETAHTERKILVFLPLSGPLAEEGRGIQEAISIALTASGLLPSWCSRLTVEYYNSTSLPPFTDSLLADPSLLAIVAHMPLPSLADLSSRIGSRPIPLVVPASSHESLLSLAHVFPLLSLDGDEGVFVATVLDSPPFRQERIAVISSEKSYSEMLFRGFVERATSQALSYRAFSLRTFRSITATSDHSPPSLIWLALDPEEALEVYRVLTASHYSGKFLFSQYVDESFLLEVPPSDYPRLLFVRPVVVPHSPPPLLRTFSEAFTISAGRAPRWPDMLFYDAFTLLLDFLRNHDEKDSPEAYLHTLKAGERTFMGISGVIAFTNGRPSRPLSIAVYRDNTFSPFTMDSSETSSIVPESTR